VQVLSQARTLPASIQTSKEAPVFSLPSPSHINYKSSILNLQSPSSCYAQRRGWRDTSLVKSKQERASWVSLFACVPTLENMKYLVGYYSICTSGCLRDREHPAGVSLRVHQSFPRINHLYSTREKIGYISGGNNEVILKRGCNDKRIHHRHWLPCTLHACGQGTPQKHCRHI